MEKLKIIIELTRLSKPIGFMLLFWPCLWGLTLAYYFNNETIIYLKYVALFLLGSILMRSAGCIFNDIVDRDFDKKVARTKNRPIASGKISVFESFIYVIILCLASLLVLLQFNKLTIILGMSSMIFAFSYPFMKRITYWPQLFLGITFKYGLILGWTSVQESMNYIPLIFYFGAIFWPLGYDTIYGLQDIHDDEIIGIKSTSIKFKNNPKVFVASCYCLCVLFILIMFFMMEINKYILFFCIHIVNSLFYQIKMFNIQNAKSFLAAFKFNNFSGFLNFIFILLIGVL